jgi:hypothetical protein
MGRDFALPSPLQPLIQVVRTRNDVSTLPTNRHSFLRPAVHGGIGQAEELYDCGPTAKLGGLT